MSANLPKKQQINQSTSYAGTGLGLFGLLMGRAAPTLGQVTRFSPVHGAVTVGNVATTDTSSSTDCALAMASTYSFVGQFVTRGAMRFAPGVGHALLAHDTAKIVGPAIMNQLDARAKGGCLYSKEAAESIRHAGKQLDSRIESTSQAYHAFQAREAALPLYARSSFIDQ